MEMLFEPAGFPILGLAGIIATTLGCMIPAIVFRGRQGQRYSPLNHFISELGEKGVSRLAAVFNSSLVIGGILNALFMIQFSRFINTRAAYISIAFGVFSSLAVSAVGLFPMNSMFGHMIAASCFFYGGMMTMIMFAVTGLTDPLDRIPPALIILAFIVTMIFLIFIVVLNISVRKSGIFDTTAITSRPSVWIHPILEWSVMLGIDIWIAAVSLYFIGNLSHL